MQWRVSAGVLLGVGLLCLSCSSKTKTTENFNQERMAQERRELRTRFAERYQAVPFPPDGFADKRVFTYNLQQALVRRDGRATVFAAQLDDVTQAVDGFVVHLTASLGDDAIFDERRLRLHLRSTYDQVKSLLDDPPAFSPVQTIRRLLGASEYAVVAKVTGVTRLEHYSAETQGEPDAELEVTSADVFSVTGELVAIEPQANGRGPAKGADIAEQNPVDSAACTYTWEDANKLRMECPDGNRQFWMYGIRFYTGNDAIPPDVLARRPTSGRDEKWVWK
jgi:hypothetical protein